MTTRSAPAPIFEDVAAATPADIDGQISRLDLTIAQADADRDYLRRKLNFDLSWDQLREINDKIDQLGRIAVDAFHQVQPLNAEFERRGGWRRYYLVEDGHLHYDVSGSRCSRIRSTAHYWMTEFSGQESAEVIAQAGERVCTTCFPEAPVAPRPATARFMTRTEAERAAHAEDKARKAAAKKAAQMTTPDGRELRAANGVHGDLIKTEIAARRRALQDASDLAFYGNSHPSAPEWRETVDRMIEALAHRTGTDEHTLRLEINNKVIKKAKRDGWTRRTAI